ncbi:MAG: class I SAM-dependent methyltransferase [Bacteroidetes bacterium]|nr:class I SAM-dependent methyltransferase [Bacteroidota bacterium]
MKYIDKIKNKFKKKKPVRKLSSRDAYRLWSSFYDDQPYNAVLFLEDKLFTEMISAINFKDKKILDIGCGTGRHWKELLSLHPSGLTGVDSSEEMLNKLLAKFPGSEVYVSDNHSLEFLKDSSFDIVISTLTIGHVREIEKYLNEWNKKLRSGGDIIITDFHPEAFSAGMKRSFSLENEVIEVENYLYDTGFLNNIFSVLKWEVISIYQKTIDNDVRHLFEKQNFTSAFRKYFGTPLITGIHLKKY